MPEPPDEPPDLVAPIARMYALRTEVNFFAQWDQPINVLSSSLDTKQQAIGDRCMSMRKRYEIAAQSVLFMLQR